MRRLSALTAPLTAIFRRYTYSAAGEPERILETQYSRYPNEKTCRSVKNFR